MTIETADLTEVRQLVRRMEQMLATPGAQAAVNPDGTPGNVASGALIESAWGNAVADSFKKLDSATKQGYGTIAGSTTVTPTGGRAVIPFGFSFKSMPVCVVCNGNAAIPCVPAVDQPNNTVAQLAVYIFNFAGTGPMTGTQFQVNWFAIGIRA
jgi:hypothetical protein